MIGVSLSELLTGEKPPCSIYHHSINKYPCDPVQTVVAIYVLKVVRVTFLFLQLVDVDACAAALFRLDMATLASADAN